MNTKAQAPPKLPPAWFKHTFWRGHRVALPAQPRPVPVDPGQQAWLGCDASHHDRPELRPESAA